MNKDTNSVLSLEVGDANGIDRRRIELEIESQGIAIRPIGYGDKFSTDGGGSPILIEFRDGNPTILIWDDINNEDPSHVIGLKNAAESNRREIEQ